MEDGRPIYVEVEDVEEHGEQRVARRKNGVEKAGSRFVDAISQVKPAAEAVLQTFLELNTPDEITLEFGIKFNARAGAILASVDTEATFKVSLKWLNQD